MKGARSGIFVLRMQLITHHSIVKPTDRPILVLFFLDKPFSVRSLFLYEMHDECHISKYDTYTYLLLTYILKESSKLTINQMYNLFLRAYILFIETEKYLKWKS